METTYDQRFCENNDWPRKGPAEHSNVDFWA